MAIPSFREIASTVNQQLHGRNIPPYTEQVIVAQTLFELIIPDEIKTTIPPTAEEIKILREKVDPLGIRKLEVLTGEEREVLLNKIIKKELAMERRFPRLLI